MHPGHYQRGPGISLCHIVVTYWQNVKKYIVFNNKRLTRKKVFFVLELKRYWSLWHNRIIFPPIVCLRYEWGKLARRTDDFGNSVSTIQTVINRHYSRCFKLNTQICTSSVFIIKRLMPDILAYRRYHAMYLSLFGAASATGAQHREFTILFIVMVPIPMCCKTWSHIYITGTQSVNARFAHTETQHFYRPMAGRLRPFTCTFVLFRKTVLRGVTIFSWFVCYATRTSMLISFY